MESAQARDVTLSLAGLSKAFGDVTAVRDLTLDVRRGEIFGLLGPNGAGKTTTISMVCGLLRPDAGEIVVDGRRVGSNGRRVPASIGLCPQDLVVWDTLTCSEQLRFVARQHDLEGRSARRRASEVLAVLGLEAKRHRLAKTLSGGLRRRLNIALALVHDPQILILDEPQAGLDPQSRILVRDYVKSLARAKTVILTTHDMDEVDRMAERVAIVDQGRLLVLDTPAALKARTGAGDVLEVRLGSDGTLDVASLGGAFQSVDLQAGTLRVVAPDALELLPRLLGELRERGATVRDLKLRKKTLEDVFIDLTGRSLRE